MSSQHANEAESQRNPQSRRPGFLLRRFYPIRHKGLAANGMFYKNLIVRHRGQLQMKSASSIA